MAKQPTPNLRATKRAAKAPSAAVVVQATPAAQAAAVQPFVAMAAALAPAPAAAPAAMQAMLAANAQRGAAPAQPATPAPGPVLALRGGLAIAAVQATGKVYRVTAPHNVAWWATVQAALAAGSGTAQVAALVQQHKVPAIMVGYLVRRGYLKAA